MICSDNSGCKKFDLIEIDGMFICKDCNVILINRLKLLLIVAKKRFINRKSNIPYYKNCKKFVYV